MVEALKDEDGRVREVAVDLMMKLMEAAHILAIHTLPHMAEAPQDVR